MSLKKAFAGAVRSVYIRARLAEERLRSGVAWWPLAAEFVADPYPVYRKLRERDPVHYGILTEQFVVSRLSDVDRILRDHRNFSNDLKKARSSRGSLGTRKKLKPSMLAQDPPDHMRLRRLVNRACTPRSVSKMEDYIRATKHLVRARHPSLPGGTACPAGGKDCTRGAAGAVRHDRVRRACSEVSAECRPPRAGAFRHTGGLTPTAL